MSFPIAFEVNDVIAIVGVRDRDISNSRGPTVPREVARVANGCGGWVAIHIQEPHDSWVLGVYLGRQWPVIWGYFVSIRGYFGV